MTIVTLRQGTANDLDAVNTLIGAAIMTWDLPDRVKRLSTPSYRYHAHDLEHLTVMVAESDSGDLMGIATWEVAESADVPGDHRGLLLHGIYVHPEHHRKRIGSRLLEGALKAGREDGYDGLLVKANKDAQRFFVAKGLQSLPVKRPRWDYPYRYWFDLKTGGVAHQDASLSRRLEHRRLAPLT